MTLLGLIVWLLVICVIAAIVWYVLQQIPLPPPFRLVILVIFAIIAIIVLLSLAGSVTGVGPMLRL